MGGGERRHLSPREVDRENLSPRVDIEPVKEIKFTYVLISSARRAGIMILPPSSQAEEMSSDLDEEDLFASTEGTVKWPKKTVLLDTDLFEVDDSWHDMPPEGFSLTVGINNPISLSLSSLLLDRNLEDFPIPALFVPIYLPRSLYHLHLD